MVKNIIYVINIDDIKDINSLVCSDGMIHDIPLKKGASWYKIYPSNPNLLKRLLNKFKNAYPFFKKTAFTFNFRFR